MKKGILIQVLEDIQLLPKEDNFNLDKEFLIKVGMEDILAILIKLLNKQLVVHSMVMLLHNMVAIIQIQQIPSIWNKEWIHSFKHSINLNKVLLQKLLEEVKICHIQDKSDQIVAQFLKITSQQIVEKKMNFENFFCIVHSNKMEEIFFLKVFIVVSILVLYYWEKGMWLNANLSI